MAGKLLKTINIEALTMMDMVNKQVVPPVLAYQRELAELILQKQAIGPHLSTSLEEGLLCQLAKLSDNLNDRLHNLSQRTRAVREIEDKLGQAIAWREKVLTAMTELRMIVDELEHWLAANIGRSQPTPKSSTAWCKPQRFRAHLLL